jgi:hypothetical protein
MTRNQSVEQIVVTKFHLQINTTTKIIDNFIFRSLSFKFEKFRLTPSFIPSRVVIIEMYAKCTKKRETDYSLIVKKQVVFIDPRISILRLMLI